MSGRASGEPGAWYKDAIFYELRTRSFFDGNDDGIGDFQGLIARLGYLADLGITALWLLPFYPSPGRDDGYDISDYTGVHPAIGTLADFDALLSEAHRRGIRVVTELVLNHTSNEHPWFRRARRAPVGSSERDFYVWASTPDRYPEARIIFKDFEPSNWSWDREAGAYYWHRFYAHQPDLNFENPAVHEALLSVVDFWLGRGVDGLRLDAVPYLYEEEGTSCENLPKTHAFLKRLRAHVDARYPERVLLAEANQWPEDAAAYFGAGDECHMNFHFPLMPRMFMAIHTEDRFPIVDIFAQTPEVHPSCQWALFLRNHDELTLEMVTDEERDTMYSAYAQEAAMRLNLGIRRRLAPLVGNDRRKMELLYGLLLSLPGTPVLYYGDEIGMGDNVYLGDRDGVRTPMQWAPDRNAGFSRANPQRMILPVIIDPQFHYESVNVENQQQNASSWLWWTKRLISLRKRFAAFGRGSTDYLSPANPRVLAFVRRYLDETLLVVANLSRFAQHVSLDLSAFAGSTPVELFGKSRFAPVGDSPYSLSLGGHAFYWFSLERPSGADDRRSLAPPAPEIECASLDALFQQAVRGLLDDAATAFLSGRPWFAGDEAVTRSGRVETIVPWGTEATPIFHAFVRADSPDSTELYSVPLTWADAEHSVPGAAVFARVRLGGEAPRTLVDATDHPAAARAMLQSIGLGGRWTSRDAELVASSTAPSLFTPPAGEADPGKIGSGRRRTTLRYGDRLVLRVARHVDSGLDPGLEVTRVLARRDGGLTPALCGTLELVRSGGVAATIATAYAFVPGATSAWHLASDEVRRFFDRVLALPRDAPCPAPPGGSALLLADEEPPPVVREMMGSYRESVGQLGSRTAELHLALASEEGDPAFAPERYSGLDRRAKYQSLRSLCGRALRRLRERCPRSADRGPGAAAAILELEPDLLRSLEPLLRLTGGGLRIRCHGDLHLRNVLYTGKTFVFTDFEGPDALSVEERRRKRSPLRDLGWMAHSIERVVFGRLFDPSIVRGEDLEAALPWAQNWASWMSAAFLRAYLGATEGHRLLPDERLQSAVLFDAFVLEQALHQLRTDVDEPDATLPVAHLTLARRVGARIAPG